MLVIEVDLRSAKDRNHYGVAYIVETYEQDEWRVSERLEVSSDTPEAKRTFLLDPARQRLRFEPIENPTTLEYDRGQMATVQKHAEFVPRSVPEETLYSSQRMK